MSGVQLLISPSVPSYSALASPVGILVAADADKLEERSGVYLPNEVLLMILSYFANPESDSYDGKHTLLKMRSVCKLFDEFASAAFFRHIELQHDYESASTYAHKLAYSPLRRHVRRLALDITVLFPPRVSKAYDNMVTGFDLDEDIDFDHSALQELAEVVDKHSFSWAYAFKNLLFFLLEQFKHQLTELSITNNLHEDFYEDASQLMELFMHVITDALNTISLPHLTRLILNPTNHLDKLDLLWINHPPEIFLESDNLNRRTSMRIFSKPKICDVFKTIKHLKIEAKSRNYLRDFWPPQCFSEISTKLLYNIPPLESLTIFYDTLEDDEAIFFPAPYHLGDVSIDVPIPSRNAYSSLKSLELRSFAINIDHMSTLIRQCCSTLSRLHISHLRIVAETWAPIFTLLANECDKLVNLEMYCLLIHGNKQAEMYANSWRSALPYRFARGSRPFLSEHEEDYTAFKLLRDETIRRRKETGLGVDIWLKDVIITREDWKKKRRIIGLRSRVVFAQG